MPRRLVHHTRPQFPHRPVLAGTRGPRFRPRQFRPTKTELGGTGNAKERLRKYLARAEANGHPIEELDRNYIAQQFRVSGRYVRDAIANHRDPKEA